MGKDKVIKKLDKAYDGLGVILAIFAGLCIAVIVLAVAFR